MAEALPLELSQGRLEEELALAPAPMGGADVDREHLRASRGAIGGAEATEPRRPSLVLDEEDPRRLHPQELDQAAAPVLQVDLGQEALGDQVPIGPLPGFDVNRGQGLEVAGEGWARSGHEARIGEFAKTTWRARLTPRC